MLAMFTVLLVCQLIGEILVVLFEIPLPGPVIGMVILLLALIAKGNVPTAMERVSGNLLSHLSLLFVPAGVGVMLHAELLKAEFLAIMVALVVSTLVTLALTGWIVQKVSVGKAEP